MRIHHGTIESAVAELVEEAHALFLRGKPWDQAAAVTRADILEELLVRLGIRSEPPDGGARFLAWSKEAEQC